MSASIGAEERLARLETLWRLEDESARARFLQERRESTLIERVQRGVALRHLSIDELGAAPGDRTLLWLTSRTNRELDGVRLGPGDPVRLWWEDPEQADALPGVVSRRVAGRLGVMIEGDIPERLDSGEFCIDREYSAVTFRRGDRAIRAMLQAAERTPAARMRELCYGEEVPGFAPPAPWRALDPSLNEAQHAAVERALRATDLALVHGPPGTGKTRTLVEIIRQSVARGERVLATAASNTAVDNLAERLVAAGVRVIRLGHPARVSPAVEAHTLDALIAEHEVSKLAAKWMDEASAIRSHVDKLQRKGAMPWQEKKLRLNEANGLMRDARRQLRNVQKSILASAQVLCATAAGADSALLDDAMFDLVALDEAAQVPDPMALVPIMRARKLVLAGDQHQLPPTVMDPQAFGLTRTLFERLAEQDRGDVTRMLTVQHRMHAAIMDFPSKSKYGGRLIAADSVAGHTLEELGVAPDPLRPAALVFIDTAGKGWEETRSTHDPSTSNPGQAARTVAELRRLLSRGLAPTSVAIIAPYDAQVRSLRERLAAEVAAGLEISTVDGFQGREAEAIVVDLVRCNDQSELGFLADTRRMNVALTRARRLLLVIGDSATISHHPYYAAFLESVQALGEWVSAWSDEADPMEPLTMDEQT
jgi:ATP-dependent RNA/DNA helicase IGHMBP2